MFGIDERFFEEIGINQMPETERDAFKKHIQEEIEVRLGERISDGMPLERLEEFEQIIDGDISFVQTWVLKNAPDYRNDPIYGKFVLNNGGQEGASVVTEYAGMKWLQINRPDFNEIIEKVINEVKTELQENISKIL